MSEIKRRKFKISTKKQIKILVAVMQELGTLLIFYTWFFLYQPISFEGILAIFIVVLSIVLGIMIEDEKEKK